MRLVDDKENIVIHAAVSHRPNNIIIYRTGDDTMMVMYDIMVYCLSVICSSATAAAVAIVVAQ